MYGKDVVVLFKGEYVKVTVPCTPRTPYSELKERAIQILNEKERKREEEKSKIIWDWIESVVK